MMGGIEVDEAIKVRVGEIVASAIGITLMGELVGVGVGVGEKSRVGVLEESTPPKTLGQIWEKPNQRSNSANMIALRMRASLTFCSIPF
jgi:hypothetical protein